MLDQSRSRKSRPDGAGGDRAAHYLGENGRGKIRLEPFAQHGVPGGLLKTKTGWGLIHGPIKPQPRKNSEGKIRDKMRATNCE